MVKFPEKKSIFETFRANVLKKPATASLRFRGICEQDLDVIYQTHETVFHRNIQTPRTELKIHCEAEYF